MKSDQGPEAQVDERSTHNREEAGSSPAGATNKLVFPCCAYFPCSEWPSYGHQRKDGAVKITVYPSSSPVYPVGSPYYERTPMCSDGERHAVCLYLCPKPTKGRKQERGFDEDGKLGYYVSCYARLVDQDGVDRTPPKPFRCQHCEEQRTYVAACRRAARQKSEAPDRAKWRICQQCGKGAEVTTDTGLCSVCQNRIPE